MKALIVSLIGSTMLLAPMSVQSNSSTIPFFIYNASSEFDLDVALLYAICRVESNCKVGAINHDDGNKYQKSLGITDKSYGMFQIKPSTAQGLGWRRYETITTEIYKHGKLVKVTKTIDHVRDLLKPEINTWYAAKLLRHLYNRYHSTYKVISAYNAGRYTTVNKDYVNKVLRRYAEYKIEKR